MRWECRREKKKTRATYADKIKALTKKHKAALKEKDEEIDVSISISPCCSTQLIHSPSIFQKLNAKVNSERNRRESAEVNLFCLQQESASKLSRMRIMNKASIRSQQRVHSDRIARYKCHLNTHEGQLYSYRARLCSALDNVIAQWKSTGVSTKLAQTAQDRASKAGVRLKKTMTRVGELNDLVLDEQMRIRELEKKLEIADGIISLMK